MARARTMPRQTATPTPAVGEPTPPESGEWTLGSAGQDLREGPEPPVEPEPPADPPETRETGAHSIRTRLRSRTGRNAEEQHSKVEDRSLLEALWSAIVAAPASVLSPPPAPPPPAPDAAPEAATADPAGTEEAPTKTAVDEPKVTAPAVGIAKAPTAVPPPPAEAVGDHDTAEPGAAPEFGIPGFGIPFPGLGLLGQGRTAANTNRTIWAGPRHAAPQDWNSTSALLTIETPASITDGGLLLLRLVVGLTMAAHGAQKAFGAFGGAGLHATATDFASLGYQPGLLFALAAVVGELFGGLLLTAGLLTPLAAGGIIGVTVNAMVAVNFSHGFFATNGGVELPLVLSGGALALLLAGPGRYAVDARIPFFNGAAVQCVAASIATFALLTSLAAHLL